MQGGRTTFQPKQVDSSTLVDQQLRASEKAHRSPPDEQTKQFCAPGNMEPYCLNQRQLELLAKVNGVNLAQLSRTKGTDFVDQSDYVRDLVRTIFLERPELNGDLSKLLDDQRLLSLDPEIAEQMDQAFLAKGPLDHSWLSNLDIDQVLIRYQKQYPAFGYLGALPSDCDKYAMCPIYQFDFADYPTKRQFGVVFNRDGVGMGGSHWISVFMCLDDRVVQFCDSAGEGPSGTMRTIMDKFKRHCAKVSGPPKEQINRLSYQADNYSCGVYSCHFIRARLAGVPWERYFQNRIGAEMDQCRKSIFRGATGLDQMDPRCLPENI